jgi:hypothetical protein
MKEWNMQKPIVMKISCLDLKFQTVSTFKIELNRELMKENKHLNDQTLNPKP